MNVTDSNFPCPATRSQPSALPHPLAGVLYGAAIAAILPLLTTNNASAAEPAEALPPPPSRLNVLMNFEFSDKYLTPRGMIVHDKGLTFQHLLLGLVNVYKGDSFINNVTLVPGIWNDFSTDGLPNSNGDGDTGWIEIDPIAGISTTFAKNWKLDVTYTAFNMQVLNIPFSQHLETKLSFDDSAYLKSFALHPYFLYWQELKNKATAAQVPYAVFNGESGPGPSHYFEFGVAPSYTFKDVDLKFEAPCRVLLPDDRFYGEYYDDASTVGLYELGIKGSIPIKCMPKGYGNWSFHAGFKYMRFVDENLQGMQEFNAPAEKTDDTWQIFCGLTAFF